MSGDTALHLDRLFISGRSIVGVAQMPSSGAPLLVFTDTGAAHEREPGVEADPSEMEDGVFKVGVMISDRRQLTVLRAMIDAAEEMLDERGQALN